MWGYKLSSGSYQTMFRQALSGRSIVSKPGGRGNSGSAELFGADNSQIK